MTSQIIAAVAAVGLLGAGVAGAAGTRSFEALPSASAIVGQVDGGAAQKCQVLEHRDGAPGVADITREVLSNGGCICHVSTGPKGGNGAAEDVVTALLRDRECENAPLAAHAAQAEAGGSNIGTIVGIGFGLAGALVAISQGGSKG